MKTITRVVSVCPSAGRGILSTLAVIVTVLISHAFAQTEELRKLHVVCYDFRKLQVGEAWCEMTNSLTMLPCVHFALGCVKDGGHAMMEMHKKAPLGSPNPPSPGKAGESSDDALLALDIHVSDMDDVELGNDADLLIFPNPSSGQIQIRVVGVSSYRLLVLREKASQPLLQREVRNEDLTIIDLPMPGHYWIIVEDGKHVWSRIIARE